MTNPTMANKERKAVARTYVFELRLPSVWLISCRPIILYKIMSSCRIVVMDTYAFFKGIFLIATKILDLATGTINCMPFSQMSFFQQFAISLSIRILRINELTMVYQ